MAKTVSNYNFEQKRKRLKRLNTNRKNIKSIMLAGRKNDNHWPLLRLNPNESKCKNST